jgi:hypothetical protein
MSGRFWWVEVGYVGDGVGLLEVKTGWGTPKKGQNRGGGGGGRFIPVISGRAKPAPKIFPKKISKDHLPFC